jgi:hypothetical protein
VTSPLDQAFGDLLPDAERAAAAGRPVIGIVGRDVPALLVAAAGAQPLRIPPREAPAEEGFDEASDVMGRAVDRAAPLVLAAVLSGSLDFLRGILVAHDSEGSLRLFYALHELHRRGRIRMPVHLVDQVHLDRESTVRFNTGRLERLTGVLEGWTSSAITTASLEDARAALARVRSALGGMRAARATGRVSGVAALQAYAVAAARPADEAAELVATASGTANPSAALPVFLTGSAPIGDALYRAIEDSGANVVGEDHDAGDPVLSDRIPDAIPDDRHALLRELALARLRGAPASASSSMAARAAATREGIAASGARALLGVVRSHDDGPAWDWHHQQRIAGVPTLLLRGDGADDPARIAAALDELRVAS